MATTKRKDESEDKKPALKNRVSVFDRTVQKSESWIAEIHMELKWMEAKGVYHLLRATLQTLRDQLDTNEAAQFASQLPLLLRGTFYECWDPKIKAKGISKQEFLESVREKLGLVGQPNFDLENGVSVTLKVIFNHVSPGEIKDVIGSLKPSLKEFVGKAESGSHVAMLEWS